MIFRMAMFLALLGVGCSRIPSGIVGDPTAAGLPPLVLERLDYRLYDRSREMPGIGGVVMVRCRGRLIYELPFGHVSPEKNAPPVTTETLFDVSSLTKPLAGWPLARHTFDAMGKDEIPYEPLLNHTSGLNDEADMPALATIAATAETAPHGKWEFPRRDFPINEMQGVGCYRYANANYVYIGMQAVFSDEDVEDWLRREYWEPMGLHDLTFHPAPESPIACSGIDANGDYLVGHPFDSLADYMVAETPLLPAHSGLFATAKDVMRFAVLMERDTDSTVQAHDLRRLASDVEAFPDCDSPSRTVYITPGGMESPVHPPFAPDGSTPGRIVMITGYTGCLLWINHYDGLSVVVISNQGVFASTRGQRPIYEDVIEIIIPGLKELR